MRVFYVMIPVSEVTPEQLKAANAPSVESTRLSVDRSECVLKFTEDKHVLFPGRNLLTFEQIQKEIQTPAWNKDAGIIEGIVSFLTV